MKDESLSLSDLDPFLSALYPPKLRHVQTLDGATYKRSPTKPLVTKAERKAKRKAERQARKRGRK